MRLDQQLVDAAIALLDARFAGKGVAAAMYTDDGMILTSVYFKPPKGLGELCAETGAICEAVKLDKRIVATVCVARMEKKGPAIVLTPCGTCQERLFHWGGQVEVATPDPNDSTKWVSKKLSEIQPYYWRNPLH